MASLSESWRRAWADRIPLGRFGEPNGDIAFLASFKASLVFGQTLAALERPGTGVFAPVKDQTAQPRSQSQKAALPDSRLHPRDELPLDGRGCIPKVQTSFNGATEGLK
mgnify:CR=1 FL=1